MAGFLLAGCRCDGAGLNEDREISHPTAAVKATKRKV
jgi:hypothetical protein